MRILVFNRGSSSLKCALFEGSRSETIAPLWKESVPAGDPLDPLLQRAGHVDAVGHRVVHGGSEYRDSVRITPEVIAAIAAQAEIAPAHNRAELTAIEQIERSLPSIPQVAVFDTAFHATLEPAAYVYPGPYEWFERDGVRRFGFHGINYQYVTRRVASLLGGMPQRMLICHLGNGASLCAVRDGKSIDTTMGFTPLEGLMMGSRSGSVDPGVLTYIMRRHGISADDLDRSLNRESGLLGLSGISSDMREVQQSALAGNQRARLALGVFEHRLIHESGGMIATLGGLDALVFTGGIGENSSQIRSALCAALAFLGIKLDSNSNLHPDPDSAISHPDSPIPVLVIAANEEAEIARECYRVLTSEWTQVVND